MTHQLENSRTAELIDLIDANVDNQLGFDNLPLSIDGATGVLMASSIPIICGGETIHEQSEMVGHCYNAGNNNNQGNYEPLATLSVQRVRASSLLWSDNGVDRLWITGGIGAFGSPEEVHGSMALVSTELVSVSNHLASVSKGPHLPTPVGSHCIVKINDSSAILTGGNHWWTDWQRLDNVLLDTYFFTKTSLEGNGIWTIGPQLPCRMHDHTCGFLLDKVTSERLVVATGGQECKESTLLLHLDHNNHGLQWTYGPSLPRQMLMAANGITPTPDKTQFILVGGFTSFTDVFDHTALLSLSCSNSICLWTTMAQQLKIPRIRGVAMLVPSTFNVESPKTEACDILATSTTLMKRELLSKICIALIFDQYHSYTTALSKILLTSGMSDSNRQKEKSEVVQLINSDFHDCAEPGDYPIPVDSAVGGLFPDGTAMFCGGRDGRTFTSNVSDCFTPGNDNPLAVMLKPRSMAASVMWTHSGNEVLWITGGFSGNDPLNNAVSTEFVSIDPNVSAVFGPEMPFSRQKHCMIKVDDSTVIFTGGEQSTYWPVFEIKHLNDTHFFNSINGWTIGPQLLVEKNLHACGLFRDRTTCDVIAVVTGGADSITSARTNLLAVNELDPTTTSGPWIDGPLLPQGIIAPSGITTQDGKEFLVVGGHPADPYLDWTSHTSIYSMSCWNLLCIWSILDQQLTTFRSWGVALLVPEDYLCY